MAVWCGVFGWKEIDALLRLKRNRLFSYKLYVRELFLIGLGAGVLKLFFHHWVSFFPWNFPLSFFFYLFVVCCFFLCSPSWTPCICFILFFFLINIILITYQKKKKGLPPYVYARKFVLIILIALSLSLSLSLSPSGIEIETFQREVGVTCMWCP